MNPLVQRIGWMLIHSIWEDILIWCLLQAVLFALAKKAPRSRYIASCIALFAMAMLPWMTFETSDFSARIRSVHAFRDQPAAIAPPLKSQQIISNSMPTQASSGSPLLSPATQQVAPSFLERLLPIVVSAWIAGLCLSGVRLWIRWRAVESLIGQTIHPLLPGWNARFAKLLQLSGVTRIIRWGETAAVSVPIVAGWLKPVILLPLGALTSMPPEQVEAILLHELAHIFRNDYLINLMQNVVETIFFYHPAVWMVSRRIRLERELACDDLTILWCKNPRVYAEALAGFEEFRARLPLLAASGEGDLLTRIRRILTGGRSERRGVPIFALAGFCGIGIYLSSMLLVPVLAQEVMTANERVARIRELQSPPKLEMPSSGNRDVYMTGTIRTEDEQPLPASLIDGSSLRRPNAMVTSERIGGWSGGSLSMTNPQDQDHKFNAYTQTGRIDLGIWAEGYAPLRKIGLQDKEGKLNIDLVLRKGFPARVRIIGPDDQPLKDVTLKATSAQSGEQLDLSMPPVLTDAAGFASFGNVESDSEIHLLASAPGWQMADQIVKQWTDHGVRVWKLEPAKATSGLVIDRATRAPIANAEILLAARRGAGDSYRTYAPETGDLLGRTDQAGRFELKDLATDQSYRIYVRAAGYETSVFPIECGDQNRTCELSSGLRLHGRILDSEGMLASDKFFHPIALQAMFTIQATPFNGYGQSVRQDLPKLGPEIPFSFDSLPKGRVSLAFAVAGLHEYRYELDLEKDTDDYVIDLRVKPPAEVEDNRPLRTVEIAIATAASSVPTGTLDADYLTTTKRGSYWTPCPAPLADGKAVISVRTPTTMQMRADRVLGYWFAPQKFDVPAGEGPFSRTVTATPAGVIHGHVTFADGMNNQIGRISPIAIKPPSGVAVADQAGGNYEALSPKGDYVTAPLPFGGAYAVVLDAGPSYFVSDSCQVDAEHPLVVRNLNVVPLHDTLKAKFVDENNAPIKYQEVMLTYHPTPDNTLICHPATTGNDGSFSIPNMNFAVPGNYEVQLHGGDWQQTEIRIDAGTPQSRLLTIQVRHLRK